VLVAVKLLAGPIVDRYNTFAEHAAGCQGEKVISAKG